MATNNNRSTIIIFFILFFGCVVGTALSQFFGMILPEGVVKDFLLNSTEIGWGSSNEWIDLNVIEWIPVEVLFTEGTYRAVSSEFLVTSVVYISFS